MTKSKKPAETPDALLDAASKDAKIVKEELSEEELKSVSGGDKTVTLEHEKVTGGTGHHENVSLSFAKINIEYKP